MALVAETISLKESDARTGAVKKCATADASLSPSGALELLSQQEVARLSDTAQGDLYELFRRCALAVLNCNEETDDAAEVFERYPDFDIEIAQRTRRIKLEIRNAPECAFVDGVIMSGVKEHLFSILRDIVFLASELDQNGNIDARTPAGITNFVFYVLRNAGLLNLGTPPKLAVCWGGHSISRFEYQYSKDVGYELGLRGLDVCTGCGPGAMKGPMKGAAIGHAKQRIGNGRYVGITEPGIIAAESPNPIVNRLVVMPDIEKRLEAFVRIGHAIIVFPGGVGTLEEILFVLGVLLDERNQGIELPLIFTGPEGSQSYFRQVDEFLVSILGEQVRRHYQIIDNDPVEVARHTEKAVDAVRRSRADSGDAFYYNWLLHIPPQMKRPFVANHENMERLEISPDLPAGELAINLRRAFSGIVAGNVKDHGIQLIREHGPFRLKGDPGIMRAMDRLLKGFVEDHRMKFPNKEYVPCYTIVE